MYIYEIVNKINGKKYIGKTKNLEQRWNKHLLLAKQKVNRILYDAMNKYGVENFGIDIIEECSAEEVDEKERFYIAKFNTINREFGYNMTIGGEGGDTLSNHPRRFEIWKQQGEKRKGHIVSSETRQKISKKLKGRIISEQQRKQISEIMKKRWQDRTFTKEILSEKFLYGASFKGHKHTDESKKKMSEARLGKTYEEIYGIEKALEIKDNKSENWMAEKNPNYVDVNMEQVLLMLKDKKMTMEQIAKEVGVARNTLLNKFKQYTGMTVDEYKIKYNINNKKEFHKEIDIDLILAMIQEGKTVKEIGAFFSVSDVTIRNRFKTKMGMTIQEYKKRSESHETIGFNKENSRN